MILSAGAIGSPHILELSGIGQPDLLKTHGIEVLHEMDAVGENCVTTLSPECNGNEPDQLSYNHRASGIGLVGEVARYLLTRRGFLACRGPDHGILKSV